MSSDRVVELHAAGKLSRQQLLYLNLPVDEEAPVEARIADYHDQVSQGSTTADGDVHDDRVSDLLQSVGDASSFAPSTVC